MMLIIEFIANDSPGFFYGDLVRSPKMGTFSPPCVMVSTAEANTLSDNFFVIVVVPPFRRYVV